MTYDPDLLDIIDEYVLQLEEGDMVLIKNNQKYFFEGDLKLILPCAPAWSLDQYENVKFKTIWMIKKLARAQKI